MPIILLMFLQISLKAASSNLTDHQKLIQWKADMDGLVLDAIYFCQTNQKKKRASKEVKNFKFQCSPGSLKYSFLVEVHDIKEKKLISKGMIFKNERLGEWLIYDGTTKNYQIDYRKLVEFDYKIGIDFSSFKIWGSITNNSSIFFKDVVVNCKIFGESGTLIATKNETIFKSFPSKKKTKFDQLNLGYVSSQANSAICELDLPKLEPLPEYFSR